MSTLELPFPPVQRHAMLKVFITIDTEIWPFSPGWPKQPLASKQKDFSRELAAFIYGATAEGEFGVPYLTQTLEDHGLGATFFVESLYASVAGESHLKETVKLIQAQRQDVQLHIHTEWLGEVTDAGLPSKFKQNIREFTVAEQTQIIATGLRNLEAAGAENICAFRAGNYGANFDTLRALAKNGIAFDSSHNTCYLGKTCEMPTPEPLLQPEYLYGVHEFPVSFFSDYPGHYRHLQLCACSSLEMKNALLQAWRNEWYAIVLVLHSSELVKIHDNRVTPDRTQVRRFQELCAFLATHTDKFSASIFSDLNPKTAAIPQALTPLKSPMHYTMHRYAEQLAARVW